MKTTTCDDCRESVALFRDGLLDDASADGIRGHIAACVECANEIRADERLSVALAELRVIDPSPITWQGVLAHRQPAKQRRLSTWKPAFAASVAVLAVVVFEGHRPSPPPKPTTRIVLQTPSDPFVGAHDMISAYDMGGDPNRLIVTMSSPTAQETTH